MKTRSILLSAAGAILALGLAVPLGYAKDNGFKLMMTPKWTGFPYFEAAAKGGKDAADELGDEFVYAGADHADVSLQVETLENFLTQKPDAIILATSIETGVPVPTAMWSVSSEPADVIGEPPPPFPCVSCAARASDTIWSE